MKGKYKRYTYIHAGKCDDCGEVKDCNRRYYANGEKKLQCIRCGWRRESKRAGFR